MVTNTGNVPLRWSVADDQGVALACPRLLSIARGQTIFCRAGARRRPASTRTSAPRPAPAPRGPRSPTPTPPLLRRPRRARHREVDQRDRRRLGPGPQIAVGDPVTWTYVVTNPGNVPIADVAVDDDQAGVSPAFVGGDDDSDGLLDPSRPGPSRRPGPRPRASTRTPAPPPARPAAARAHRHRPVPLLRRRAPRSRSRSRPTAPTPTPRPGR